MSFKKVEFNSVGELIDAVMDGREIYNSTKDLKLAYIPSSVTFAWSHRGRINNKISIQSFKRDVKRFAFFEKYDWRETVSKDNPVWCWVDEDKTRLFKINSYDKMNYYNPYSGKGGYFSFAIPVTKEEFKKLAESANE